MQKIHFKDNGQDLLWVIVDNRGFIIDCNRQKSVWCGFKVILDFLFIGEFIFLADKNGRINEYDFTAKKIELIEEENKTEDSTHISCQ
jgi:hypothetical protein